MKPGHKNPPGRNRGLSALLLSAALCSPQLAMADMLAYESFNYSEGSEVEGGSGGSGWAAAWLQQASAGGSETINAGNLITGYPGFDAASQGKSATLNAGHRVARLLDVSGAGSFGSHGYLDANGNIGADGTTIYLSFVIAETGGNPNGYFEFVINRDSLGDPGRIGGIGDDLGSADFNLRTGVAHTRVISRDTDVHRFVVRFDFLPGNDRMTVYADPTSSAEPVAGDVQVTLSDMSFDGVSFAAFNGGNILSVDEIRITTTFAEAAIAGAPEWTGGNAPFGAAANWSTGQVPAGIDASILNGGSAQIGEGDAFEVDGLFIGGHDGNGTLVMGGGQLDLSSLSVGGANAAGGTGTGTVSMTGGGISGAGGGEIAFGSHGGTGTLNLGGGAAFANDGPIYFGRDGGTAHGTIGGNATVVAKQAGIGFASPGKISELSVKDQGTFRVTGGNLVAGWLGDVTGKGILKIQDSALVEVNGELRIGYDGASGELQMTGGTLQVTGSTGYLVSGRSGGTGSITISGNSHVAVSRFMMAGSYINGSGSITVNEGAVITAERFTIAYEHDTSGVFTVNGGELLATASGSTGVVLGGGGTGTSRRLDLNGGTVTAGGFAKKDGNLPLDINFNGGTIRAAGDNADYFRSGNADGSSLGIVASDLELQPGGLEFDTAGFTVGITQALSGDGGLTKSGAGTLGASEVSNYRGETIVLGGTLKFTHPSLDDDSTVRVSGEGSTLNLEYAGTDTIARLVINGVIQSPGLYCSAEAAGPGTVLPQLAGAGVLSVSGQSPDYASWLAGNPPATGFVTDSDGDGIPNGVEHVLGSDPNLFTPGLIPAASGAGSMMVSHGLNPQLGSDVSYHYEWSTDLVEWKTSGQTNTSGSTVTILSSPPVGGQVSVTLTPAGSIGGKLFMRLAADLAP